MDKSGRYLFIAGLVIAVLAGLIFSGAAWATWVLAILGLVVGFLNVSGEETKGFLLAGIAFILTASALQSVPVIGEYLTSILDYVVVFVSGALLVVALQALFDIGSE
ncbi:MAG: hypothetical protein MAG431_02418 [Chloroflexi bacterium]|nr:hypothetical protein [Chloroflexota bacterium]